MIAPAIASLIIMPLCERRFEERTDPSDELTSLLKVSITMFFRSLLS